MPARGRTPFVSRVDAYLTAGLSAGFASTSLLYPLEVIRTQFQANQHKQRRTFVALRNVIQSAGVRGLYSGFVPGIVGSTLAWGEFFYVYNAFKGMVLRAGGDKDRRLRPWHHMSCSFASGVVVQLTLSPLWVVKNNQQLGTYTSFFTGARKLWRSEGLRGFYRGITPGVLSAAQGGIQFLVYEEMRRLALAVQVKGQGAGSRDKQRARHGLGLLPVPVTMGITVLSKTAALLATSPLEVIKIRMRHVKSGEGYATVAEAASTIWNKEGVFGFYKGLGTNLIRLMPSQCITFVVYESVKEALLLRQESDTADTAAPP